MKKKSVLLSMVMFLIGASNGLAYEAKKKTYQVTVVNLTKGQPITPAVVAVHAPSFNLFELGKEASVGLKALAQDGVTDKLVNELAQAKLVIRSAVGNGVILPGKSQTIKIEANNPHFKLSLVSMLARTNDAITGKKGLSLFLKPGEEHSTLGNVYDAGAEQNTEECAHIPAPPCGNAMSGTNGGEGFVRPHEGILGLSDLELSRDAFAQQAIKITVKRIQ